jgi:hypothetical protein
MERVLIYQLLLAGLILSLAWASVAYGAAFRATRRQAYRDTAIALLGLVITYTTLAFVMAPESPLSVLPFMFPAVIAFASCFGATPDAKMPEYGSPRDIMLFKAPLPAMPHQAGLFVPAATPRRTSPWVILAMMTALLVGLALMRLFDF